eukprot:6206687-Pleurochrysis_carterae.AAC.2
MGHWQGFAAIYADGGICGISPATRSDVSDWQLCFAWCRLPRSWRPCFIWVSAPYLNMEVGDNKLYGAPHHAKKWY